MILMTWMGALHVKSVPTKQFDQLNYVVEWLVSDVAPKDGI